MGGFRVLPSGDVLRANGLFSPDGGPSINLIHPGGQPAWDLYFPPDYYNYRAACFTPPWPVNRPEIQCEPFGNGLRLFLTQSYPNYLWTTGETTPSIVVQDTGRYQVYVPQGIGRLGSREFHLATLNGQCPPVSTPEASLPHRPPARLLRTVDLMGREVMEKRSGQVYVEVYSDGKRRKIVRE
jgi:hypothetical protein